MTISLGNAINSVLKNDLKWKLGMKLIMLLPIFLTPFIVVDMVKVFSSNPSGKLLLMYIFLLLLWFLICWYCASIGYGYTLKYVHDVIKNPDAKLPEWKNFNKLFLYGVSFPLCMSTLSCCLTTIMSFTTPVANKVPVLMIVFGLLFFIMNIFFWLCMPGLQINYCKELKISDGLDIIEARKYIRKPLLWFVLNYILLGLITLTIASILTITIIGVLLVVPLYVFSGLVSAHLFAQLYHDVSELNTSVTRTQNNTSGIMVLVVVIVFAIGGLMVVSNLSKIIDTVKGITQFGSAMTTTTMPMPAGSSNVQTGMPSSGSSSGVDSEFTSKSTEYYWCDLETSAEQIIGGKTVSEEDVKKTPEDYCLTKIGDKSSVYYNDCILEHKATVKSYKSGNCKKQ